MKEKTAIKHKCENNEYCTEILYKEHWGSNDIRLTCEKCAFIEIIDKKLFQEWLLCKEAKINRKEDSLNLKSLFKNLNILHSAIIHKEKGGLIC